MLRFQQSSAEPLNSSHTASSAAAFATLADLGKATLAATSVTSSASLICFAFALTPCMNHVELCLAQPTHFSARWQLTQAT